MATIGVGRLETASTEKYRLEIKRFVLIDSRGMGISSPYSKFRGRGEFAKQFPTLESHINRHGPQAHHFDSGRPTRLKDTVYDLNRPHGWVQVFFLRPHSL